MTELRNQDEETPGMGPWPYFAPDELEAVAKVLRSSKVSYWTGTEGREFEKEYAAFVGCQHGVAVANGTVSLELALYALSVGAGDEVIFTPRTFMASASCVVMRGATPVMADVDPVSQNITAETIAKVLSSRNKAIICVHLAGWPAVPGGSTWNCMSRIGRSRNRRPMGIWVIPARVVDGVVSL